jgi:hypothetical protein
MQTYNPNNPVYKYKSDKPIVPTEAPNEETKVIQKPQTNKSPNSYGLYLQPTEFKDATMKSTTYLQYITFTIDTSDRDYTKYPNPFDFVTDKFSEYFKNVKVFQIYYLTLPQFNLVQIPLSQDANYTFMHNYVLNNPITNNLLITSAPNTGIAFSTGVGSGSITCTGVNALTCAGNFSATTYGGGIGNLYSQFGFSGLVAGAADGVIFPISNFVGSNTTSYVISGNGDNVSPPNVLFPLIWNVSWESTVGTTTNVLVTITNVGSTTITGAINFSVIAMN